MNLEDLLGKLDLKTKVRLLTGATFFTLHHEPAIGLAADGVLRRADRRPRRGVRQRPHASLLPNATLLASAWSEETAHAVGALLAEEAERQHIHVVFGPTINLHRSPLGGRLFEAYSEDPLLTGRLAAAYVHGLQEHGVGACLKHLVANEAETERHTVNSVVDERTLRELYLLPFEIAVQDADPWSVMAAYNDVNGVAATEQDDINNGILKEEWGWSGLLMSDWFATKSAGPAANGGLDLVMPGPAGPWGDALVERGRKRRSARGGRSTTMCGACCSSQTGSAPSASHALARGPARTRQRRTPRTAARPGRLRHDRPDNDGTLPLAARRPGRTHRPERPGDHCMGGGSAQVRAPHQVSVAEGLTERLGDRSPSRRGRGAHPTASARRDPVIDPVTASPGMRIKALRRSRRPDPDAHAAEGYSDHQPRRRHCRAPARAPSRRPCPPAPCGSACWVSATGSCGSATSRVRLSPTHDERPGRVDLAASGLVTDLVLTSDRADRRGRPQRDHLGPQHARRWSPSRRRRRTTTRSRPRSPRLPTPTSRSWWSASPRSRRPRPSTRRPSPCPAGRTSSS